MDRLTGRHADGKAYVRLRARFDFQDCTDRLAAYEDTGLEPDEIPHWIPVSERIPEKSQNCLCYFNDGSTAICWSNGEPYKFHPDVTHWMPLPQPPKEGK